MTSSQSVLLSFHVCYLSVFQVEHDLLHTVQSRPVIKLLEKAISMVKEDPQSAMSCTLSMMETPTSSPTSHRKGLESLADGAKDASKVHIFFSPFSPYSRVSSRSCVELLS